MPFTPAHPAAVLPVHAVARRLGLRLPLSALVIGSMAPDFEYFFRLKPYGRFGHSPLGLLVFSLPVGLAAWIMFRGLVAPALLRLLPPGLAAALWNGRTRASPAALVGLAAVAVLVGAMTHAVWDLFTHGGQTISTLLPVIRERVAPTVMPRLRWYTVLQYVSTIVGLAVIGVASVRWVLRQPPEARRFAPGQPLHSLGVVAFLIASAAVGGVVNSLRGVAGGIFTALAFGAVGGMVALTIALIAYGVVVFGAPSRVE
jgi:uncharacterized protein DUF4184